MELFRNKDVDFLIATDVAARVSDVSGLYGFRLFIDLIKDNSLGMISMLQGLDIVGVETVINFECPRDITTLVLKHNNLILNMHISYLCKYLQQLLS